MIYVGGIFPQFSRYVSYLSTHGAVTVHYVVMTSGMTHVTETFLDVTTVAFKSHKKLIVCVIVTNVK